MAEQAVLVPAVEKKSDTETAGGGSVSLIEVVERLAANPQVDVDKLERIIQLQDRFLAREAKAAFDTAFAAMQSALPEISERGRLIVKGTLRSTYAKLEDIQAAIKPVLKAHGFSIRHRTEYPADRPKIIRIVGILTHTQGHSEETAFEAEADHSDYRTDIQSAGSTVSYGRRYTTLDLLNITTRGQDDDGKGATTQKNGPEPPAGYGDWLTDMIALAGSDGLPALEKAWKDSKPAYRAFITQHEAAQWHEIKAAAAIRGRS